MNLEQAYFNGQQRAAVYRFYTVVVVTNVFKIGGLRVAYGLLNQKKNPNIRVRIYAIRLHMTEQNARLARHPALYK